MILNKWQVVPPGFVGPLDGELVPVVFYSVQRNTYCVAVNGDRVAMDFKHYYPITPMHVDTPQDKAREYAHGAHAAGSYRLSDAYLAGWKAHEAQDKDYK